ncbi:multidrug efflux pump-associated protein, AcrZ family [Candidatus Hamiltonella defensa]|nr:AcrZ family multidrug efflux pump-associated protein [Candidatus Hamiltonella defensa]ASV33224.1 multidrug efflux pump-associated protein, AcrZ family [Candidatus Hamiltonella defensa]AWK16184.1 multidrug efflux pump-associated protein, AcrZ family [Candidatus Hamiltonella defensa]AYB48835.1 multidrug efflux pump-associated protein, AcrZ family [Candidatus Hamiltonella defensa]MBK4361418.1 multidrug efflux pump-associated protein, AcrZ family [Candidatus Hamiltonella defensa]
MFELLKSFLFALLMVPVMITMILSLIYGFGKIFNLISHKNDHSSSL